MTEVGADAGPLRSVGVEEKFLVLRRTSTVLVDALTVGRDVPGRFGTH